MTTASFTPDSPVNVGKVLNIAAYKFVPLDNLEDRRTQLKAYCVELGLLGTILLSPEGINMFVAGEPTQVEQLLAHLRGQEEFTDLEAKRSYSDKVPFRRMLVRLKKEIIPCGIESIQPEQKTSPKLSAKELKQWLDQGRKVRLLDVRNKYEIELGTFEGAEELDLGHFRDFPEAVDRMPEEAKTEPLVMFCTGGIRCEKAGPVMEEAGFKEVYQLDGGILKYFEECGGEHYDGSCFVFDGRVALDPELNPTGNLLCFACQAVLDAEDVISGKFLFGEYCPKCYQAPEERERRNLSERQTKITQLAETQPGSKPYTNKREIHVAGRFAGMPLLDFLTAYQPRIEREEWQAWLDAGEIVQEDASACTADQEVREGQRFIQYTPNTVEPNVNPNITLEYEDDSLIVVNKPAPLPCHPSGRFNRNTLSEILAPAYPQEKLRVAHRLDALTTGVTLLCRKYRPAKLVQAQFAEQRVEKVYLARVQGHPAWEESTCDKSISVEPVSSNGARAIDEQGRSAETQFRVVERFVDGTSLVEARPRTGRTNQIRIHLKELGHSIVGDPLYGSGKEADTESAPVMCLHAKSLTLIHPDTNAKTTFEVANPEWAQN